MTDYELAVLAELRAIRVALEGRRSGGEYRHLALLQAIAQATPGRVFSVRELLAHALVDPELCAAINGMSGKQIGRALRRIEGREISGLRVERVGEDNQGLTWTVRKPPKVTLAIA